ncbi:MAG: hypothetical protein GF401_15820 [Chitinivibrionales bacterium]|nr:hypothetical protein [Chitinivibrionales bacterium]
MVAQIRTGILLLFFILVPSMAQWSEWLTDMKGENTGHTVCNFLTLPVSVGDLGRGLSASPGMMDATVLPNFTATSAYFDSYKFAASHIEWLQGLRKEYTGACFPVFGVGTIGVFSQLFTVGEFPHSRDIDELPSSPRFFECAFGASYAREILYRTLAGGMTFSYIESRLDNEAGRSVAGHADLALDLPFVKARLYGGNFGPELTYIATPEPLPLQTGVSLFFMPLAHRIKLKNRFALEIGGGVQKNADEPLLVGFSTEMGIMTWGKIRGGYEFPLGQEQSIAGLSLGAGFTVKNFGADFGWKYQSEILGGVWGITATMQLEEIVPKTAEDFYEVAHNHFSKERYRLCTRYAKEALRLNPNMWKAHTIIARAQAELRQEKGSEIALIYAGGAKGQTLPFLSEKEHIGGIARGVTVIRQLRDSYPASIGINTGNNILRVSHKLKGTLFDKYYETANWDAVALGAGELDFGFERYLSEANVSNTKFICTNAKKVFGKGLIKKDIIDVHKYKIMVLSVVNPSLPSRNEDKALLTPVIGELQGELLYPEAKKCNLRVLVADDNFKNMSKYAQALPEIDIIICSGLHREFHTPMTAGSTLILSAGDSSRYVGTLAIRFDDEGKMLSYNNKLIPLTNRVIPDPVMDELARKTAITIELEQKGIDLKELAKGAIDGTFLFVSNRHGKKGIFLKVIDKLAEFPLSPRVTHCFSPVYSYECGKIAFLQNDEKTGATSLISMSFNGTQVTEICSNFHVSDICFGTQGDWIYFAAGKGPGKSTALYRVKPSGGVKHPLITWDNSRESDIDLSPDGSQMVFISDRDRLPQVYMASSAGEKPLRISNAKATHAKPKFSPHGTSFAFLSDRMSKRNRMDLFVHDLVSGKTSPLTRQANVSDFCWTEDSKQIIYSAGVNLCDLTVIDTETGMSRKLITGHGIKDYSELHPQLMRYKGKTGIIYYREYESGERQIYRVNLDGSDNTRIVNSTGNDWLE